MNFDKQIQDLIHETTLNMKFKDEKGNIYQYADIEAIYDIEVISPVRMHEGPIIFKIKAKIRNNGVKELCSI